MNIKEEKPEKRSTTDTVYPAPKKFLKMTHRQQDVDLKFDESDLTTEYKLPNKSKSETFTFSRRANGPDNLYLNSGSGSISLDRERLPWNTKRVLEDFDMDEVFQEIRLYLDSITEEEDFMAITYPFLHFNYYCIASGVSYTPAEFGLVAWSLQSGLQFFGGSPIDPGEKLYDLAETFKQCDVLHLLRPPYTYSNGPGYSVGEDRYENVLQAIFAQGFTLPRNDPNRESWKYVFAAEENMNVVAGCLGWLMNTCGRDPRLRVLSIERIVGEIFRSCMIRKISVDFKAQIINGPYSNLHKTGIRIKVDPDAPTVNCIEGVPIKVSAEQSVDIERVSSISYVKIILHANNSWNLRLRLGCHWHQRQDFCDGIMQCSTMFVKKWMYLTLEKALEILDKDFGPFSAEMKHMDMKPQNWTTTDSIGIEARQRFGSYGGISSQRRKILEEGFIFPRFLEVFRKQFPKGLTQVPKDLIWPVDRDIQLDLNIPDPDPEGRARKRIDLERKIAQKSAREIHNMW